MSKRLVICCDGTWNFPDQQCPTNVTKVALAAAPTDSYGREQRAFYHRATPPQGQRSEITDAKIEFEAGALDM